MRLPIASRVLWRLPRQLPAMPRVVLVACWCPSSWCLQGCAGDHPGPDAASQFPPCGEVMNSKLESGRSGSFSASRHVLAVSGPVGWRPGARPDFYVTAQLRGCRPGGPSLVLTGVWLTSLTRPSAQFAHRPSSLPPRRSCRPGWVTGASLAALRLLLYRHGGPALGLVTAVRPLPAALGGLGYQPVLPVHK